MTPPPARGAPPPLPSRLMIRSVSILASALFLPLLPAQETYWLAGTGGVKHVDVTGALLQTVPPTSTRDVAVAPDGKVWIIASGLTILNADGTPFRTVTPSTGISPYDLAFDSRGHAWVSGGTAGVEEFDAAGNSQGTVALLATNGLGITVDAQDNKWIAHRNGPPGTLSRIDGTTRAVTNHAMPAGSLILPIKVYADARGLLQPSHIWVLGDNRGAGEICEFDATGAALNRYILDATGRFQWMSGNIDATGRTTHMWVGDWGNGNLYRVDVATGIGTNFPQGAAVRGVTFDGFGKLWVVSGTGATGVLRRVDPTTGNAEVNAAVQPTGAMSTRWQFASTVNPLGDLDGDGASNFGELINGSSPFDACSTPSASIQVDGSTAIGGSATIVVRASASDVTGLAFATSTTPVGFTLPGVACSLRLSPLTLASVVIPVTGAVNLPVTIPNNPSLVGASLYVQGLNVGALTFTNVPGFTFH
jgi:streptogramin lyase